MNLTIKELIRDSHQISKDHGWWEDPNKSVGELLALVHSEISEALEVYRDLGKEGLSKNWVEENGKPEGFTVELADAIIRIADMCGAYELDLEEALTKKMEYNKSRPYRHGGKKA
ncbi:MAG: hypothetical protein LR120_00725 [Dehalococcoidia bacterium]|nr:hypothetical protein [Dehalococcoidia bacterium]MQG00719.1 hypothetical protein [SAR202 cluster bacterium]|tara:strand:+ start:291 stop:635 length:345 start_codon:yes stop_codon:yes gene_type:complete